MGMSLALFSFSLWKKRSSKTMMRRVRKKRKGEDLVAPEITLDLKIEILTRLPAKSLMRFKCVSKLWFSLIHSRYFTNLYQIVAPPRLYVSLMEHIECDSMEICHKPGKYLLVSLSSSSSNNAESFDQELTMPGIGHSMMVLRGLILYKVCRKAGIYNPTTRQSLTLPAVNSNIFAQEGFEKDVDYFLGHDPVLDRYKVVCTVSIYSEDYEMVTSEHWVFVVEVGGSWKRIEFNQPHNPTDLGVCINGVIYYMADTCISGYIAVSFDVRSEEFSTIQAPEDDASKLGDHVFVGFIEYGGRPAILDQTHLREKGLLELWVLEDGGKWSKKSLVLQPCHMHLVSNISLIVEGTTRNGEVILSAYPMIPLNYYILYYDLQKNDLRKVNIIRRIPDQEFIDPYISLILMDKSESIMHLET